MAHDELPPLGLAIPSSSTPTEDDSAQPGPLAHATISLEQLSLLTIAGVSIGENSTINRHVTGTTRRFFQARGEAALGLLRAQLVKDADPKKGKAYAGHYFLVRGSAGYTTEDRFFHLNWSVGIEIGEFFQRSFMKAGPLTRMVAGFLEYEKPLVACIPTQIPCQFPLPDLILNDEKTGRFRLGFAIHFSALKGGPMKKDTNTLLGLRLSLGLPGQRQSWPTINATLTAGIIGKHPLRQDSIPQTD